jgi:hypothetical protein
MTNSSCGVCGKSSLDALEIIKKEKTLNSDPKLTKEIIIQSPSILRKINLNFLKLEEFMQVDYFLKMENWYLKRRCW